MQKEGLFILPWDGTLPRNVRIESLEYASADEVKRFLQLTMIKNIQSSPLKLTILERWEKEAFFSFADATGKLRDCPEVWTDYDDTDHLWYIDLCAGNLTWTSYNLILQCCRENDTVVIFADPANLKANAKWSGWTDVFLDKFCPRTEWENHRENFILHLKADMEIAHQRELWFKFKLHFEGGSYKPIEHRIYVQQKVIWRNVEGDHIESRVTIRDIPLDFRVESKLRGEFICEPLEVFHGSDIQCCFSPWLYLLPPNIDATDSPIEDAQGYDSPDEDIWEYLQGRDLYD